MPVVGSGDRNGVHVFGLEHSAKILFRFRELTQFLIRAVGELGKNFVIHIADVGGRGQSGGSPLKTRDAHKHAHANR
jgi:hypothetical protein